jgi:cytoskeletal protein CcmA (bactofilin family)
VFKKTEINQPLTNLTKINQDTSMEGEIVSKSDIRLDGNLTGKMITRKKIIIGKKGFFSGKIKCETLIVQGIVKGEATVTKSTALHDTSTFNGILSTQKFSVEEGAIFDGNCITLGESKSTDLKKLAEIKEEIQSSKSTTKPLDSIKSKEDEVEEEDDDVTDN